MGARVAKVLAVFAVIVITGFLARPAGVGEVTADVPARIPSPAATATAEPTGATSTAEPSRPTPEPTLERSSAASAQSESESHTVTVHPVDFTTLGLQGPALGLYYGRGSITTAASPDGRWFAVAWSWDEGEFTLQVRATDALHAPVVDRSLLGLVEGLQFTPDGSALSWVRRPSEAGPRQFFVHYAPLGAKAGWVTGLPLGFEPSTTQALAGGRVAVYGHYVGEHHDRIGRLLDEPPRVMVLSKSGTVADVGLPVTAPLMEQQGRTLDGLQVFLEHRPGLAWDTANDRLYVAHADADIVTVVDLATGALLNELVAGPSLAERLGGLFGAGTAHAGGYYADGTIREALLSPDGSRLYVWGHRQTAEIDRYGGHTYEPLPLLVFDTGAGQLVHSSEPLSESLVDVSADGSALLTATAWWAQGSTVLRVLDAETLQPLWERKHEGLANAAFNADGHVLVTRAGLRSSRLPRVQLLEASSGEAFATYDSDSHVTAYPEADLLLEWPE